MRQIIIVLFVCLLVPFKVTGQFFEKNMVLLEIKNHDLLLKDGQLKSSDNMLQYRFDALMEKYGKYKIEKAFPYAPTESKRSKKIVLRFSKEIDVGSFKQDLFSYLDGYQVSIDSIPIVYVTGCNELYPPPNDLTGPYSNEELMDLIRGECAWDITTGNDSIKIAIIDRLFNASHEDLNDNISEYRDFSNSGEPSHGIMVAGNASATTNNGVGISSIGFDCDLLLYNVGGSTSSSISVLSAANAIDYAVQQGASVINCSFGANYPILTEVTNDAISAGVSVVGSAGHPNIHELFYPGSNPDVVCVSSVTIENYHGPTNDPHYPRVDICAPVTGYWKTAENNSYIESGCCTSNSTPIVSGTLGLMHSVNNGYSPRELRYFIIKTGTEINDQAQYADSLGGGTLNAYKAVRRSASNHLQNIELLANETISSDYDIFAGEDVLPDNNGPVIVKNGANIIFDSEEVYLEGGFEVEKGGTFEVQ